MSGTTYTQGYSVENMLTSVRGGASASFVYDGDGQRVKGTVAEVTTVYVGDHYEWTGTCGGDRQALLLRRRPADRRAGGRQHPVLPAGRSPFAALRAGLGSTSITANTSGGFVAEVRYLPWGETRYVTGTTAPTFRFTGPRQQSGRSRCRLWPGETAG